MQRIGEEGSELEWCNSHRMEYVDAKPVDVCYSALFSVHNSSQSDAMYGLSNACS